MTIALILAAGRGSRLRPLTNRLPKCLLSVGDKTILERMINSINKLEFEKITIVIGFQGYLIKEEIANKFPSLNVSYIENKNYEKTNNSYSLWLTKAVLKNKSFIKFDADVVFEQGILNSVFHAPFENCLCYDSEASIDLEEVKVIIKKGGLLHKANKQLPPLTAHGESVGIEKIHAEYSTELFSVLDKLMSHQKNHQHFYERVYEELIFQGKIIHTLDVKGFKWIEIDTKEDLQYANRMFS